MDKISGEEGCISLGPWGGKQGKYWAYKPDGQILQITIRYDIVINSILFESKSHDGVIGSSEFIGDIDSGASTKGNIIAEEGWISLGPWGGEWEGAGYLTYKPDGPIMEITICYGRVINSILFESKSRDGVVIGSSRNIGGAGGDAFAQFYIDSSVEQFCIDSSVEQFSSDKIRGEEGCISLGPWGGNDGDDWAYKTNGPIMQISICYGQAIDSILFESKSCDGVLIGSPKKIGGSGGHATETITVGPSPLWSISESILLSHTASHAASVAAIYSVSAEDKAIVLCFLELQDIILVPKQNTWPDVLFRSSIDPAQSLSV
ncbi:hypothetical protein RHSIM_Rhsim01G0064500 [Rhododendron simsii]|uniref:Jacalin-type lectin domain-containing protein n=1 Tax=Rhododendron simsii TaxID=118357 RepID=A0A834LZA0_RHOSS|nr:hypothetical protein RHSIM_Rhsim01G0064500 [Rhododendron simsii]